MSPQEQAQAIVQLCTRRHGDFHYWNGDCRAPAIKELVDGIATALAASAAKVTELDQDKTRLQRDVDGLEATRMDLSNRCGALTAKLEDITANRDYWFNTAEAYLKEIHEETAKLQASEQAAIAEHTRYVLANAGWKETIRQHEASERALEQVRGAAFVAVNYLTYLASPAGDLPIYERERAIAARDALDKVALASPEARATGEDSA